MTSFRYFLGVTSCALQVASKEQMTDILTAASWLQPRKNSPEYKISLKRIAFQAA